MSSSSFDDVDEEHDELRVRNEEMDPREARRRRLNDVMPSSSSSSEDGGEDDDDGDGSDFDGSEFEDELDDEGIGARSFSPSASELDDDDDFSDNEEDDEPSAQVSAGCLF